ncbi:hypothetical protein P20652_0978 [Pseudoalteromonas sp. BSi20652]|nr:hypothetical protein P20652_0978 [Pseudoalteromonas sp. BSi20652]
MVGKSQVSSKVRANKLMTKGQKTIGFAPSPLILTSCN